MSNRTEKTENWRENWLAFKNGDMDAFQRIYIDFFDKLYAYGSKLTVDSTLLEDSIQELFLELYTKRQNLSVPDNLEFYLLKSLKLTIYQKHRKKGNFILVELKENAGVESGFVFVNDVERREDESEKDRQLTKMLENLDASQRELLFLKFYKNLSYKEIGNLLAIQPDSAKKQVYRIIKRLKHSLKGVTIEFFIFFKRIDRLELL